MSSNDPKNKKNKMTRTGRNNQSERRTPIWQFVVIGLLLVILIYLLVKIFSSGSNKTPDNIQFPTDVTSENINSADSSNSSSQSTSSDASDSETEDEETTDEEQEEENSNQDEETELEETTPSDDLVTEAFTGDWPASGTSQEGTHTTTDFGEGSADRREIKKASSIATGISEDNMFEWWVGNNGPNRVITTVSDKSEENIYRVYMEWVDGDGWKATKIEKLKENDKKNR